LVVIILIVGLVCPSARAAQAGNIRIDNLKFVQWGNGPVRESSQFLPGERVTASFDIDGITVSDAGGISLDIGFMWCDARNRILLKGKGASVTKNPLRGSISCVVRLGLPLTTNPGNYYLKVHARDNLSGATVLDVLPFSVVPLQLAIVNLRLTLDKEGKYERPPEFYVRDTANVIFDVVGFTKQNEMCAILVSYEIDEGGSILFKKDPAVVFKNVLKPPVKDQLNMKFSFLCTRCGHFTVKIKVVDQLTNEVVTKEIPIVVKSPS